MNYSVSILDYTVSFGAIQMYMSIYYIGSLCVLYVFAKSRN